MGTCAWATLGDFLEEILEMVSDISAGFFANKNVLSYTALGRAKIKNFLDFFRT